MKKFGLGCGAVVAVVLVVAMAVLIGGCSAYNRLVGLQQSTDSTWAQVAFVKATGAAPLDHFGHTVSLQGGNARLYGGARGLTANAPGVNRNHKQNPALPSPTPGAGGSLNGAAAYAFELTNNGTWVETAKMIAPNADVADFSSFHALSPGGDGTVALATGVRDAAGNVARRIFIY